MRTQLHNPAPKRIDERQVILIGVALIVLVIIISVARVMLRPDAPAATDDGTQGAADLTVNTISPEDLKNRLTQSDADKKTLVLDLRDPDDFGLEHIVGSRNVTPDAIAGMVPAERPDGFLIAIVNRSSDETATRQTVHALMQSQIPAAMLQGGFEGWVQGLGSTISWGNPNSVIDASKVHVITPEEAKEALDTTSKKFITLIDTRSTENFRAGHIPGAFNVPLAELEARRKEIYIKPNTIVYSDGVVPSFQSATRLFDLNFFNTSVIDGGFDAWKTKGYPVDKGS